MEDRIADFSKIGRRPVDVIHVQRVSADGHGKLTAYYDCRQEAECGP
jgi:hypothetical protein